MSNFIREEEKFVIEALCGSFGGTWRPGEDPPDSYLIIDNIEIAVEISMLTQHVLDKYGVPEPRLSQDSGVLKLCDELDNELHNLIWPNVYIILTLRAPIENLRKFKKILKQNLIEILKLKILLEVNIEINGNIIKVKILNGRRESGKKIVGIVTNERSTAHLTSNASFILFNRISEKNIKCLTVHHRPMWLALFNDYWLAGPDTYLNAMEKYNENHTFEKIFIVNGNSDVHLIYKA